MPNEIFLSLSSHSPLSQHQRVYLEALRSYLQCQFEFLAYVDAGLAERPADFKARCKSKAKKALTLVSPVAEQVAEQTGALADVLCSAIEMFGDDEKSEAGLIVFQRRWLANSATVTVAMECVAREAACGWDFFLNQGLADEASIRRFAWVGAQRIVDHCLHTGCDWTADTFWQGLIEGRSGQGYEGRKNHELTVLPSFRQALGVSVQKKYTAEVAYARSGYVSLSELDGAPCFHHCQAKERFQTPLNAGCSKSACSNDVARGFLWPTTPMKGECVDGMIDS